MLDACHLRLERFWTDSTDEVCGIWLHSPGIRIILINSCRCRRNVLMFGCGIFLRARMAKIKFSVFVILLFECILLLVTNVSFYIVWCCQLQVTEIARKENFLSTWAAVLFSTHIRLRFFASIFQSWILRSCSRVLCTGVWFVICVILLGVDLNFFNSTIRTRKWYG